MRYSSKGRLAGVLLLGLSIALSACSGGSTITPPPTRTSGDELGAPISCADQAIAPGSMASAVVVIGVADTLNMMAGCSAQLAYKQGAAVVLDGRSDASLLNILNLNAAVMSVSAGSASQQITNIVGTPEAAPASPGDPTTPVLLEAVALKALPNGEVAAFHSFDVDVPTSNANAKRWASAVVADPSIGAWVPQYSNLVIVPPADRHTRPRRKI